MLICTSSLESSDMYGASSGSMKLSSRKAGSFDLFSTSSETAYRNGATSSADIDAAVGLNLPKKLCLEWWRLCPADWGLPDASDLRDRDEPGRLSCGASISRTAECLLEASPILRVAGMAIMGVVADLSLSMSSGFSTMLISSSALYFTAGIAGGGGF